MDDNVDYGLYEDAAMPFDEEGIAAVQHLQNMAGITESRSDAEASWLMMNYVQRAQTLRIYRLAKGGF